MSRLYIAVLLAVLLQGCAGIPFADALFPPTNTPAPSATATKTSPPTRTPVPTNTPRPSATATIVRFPTQDPNQPTATFLPTIPIFIGRFTATAIPVFAPTFPAAGSGFASVTVSPNKVYWGICQHNKATIIAKVEDDDEVWSVVIFVRVKSVKEEDYTPWTTGNAMHDHRNGTYSYVLRGIEIEGHNHYKDSWVLFQLVATNVEGEEVGRTQIYTESIHLSPCMELGD